MEPRTLICVETSMSQDYVVQVTSCRLNIEDQQGLPTEWLIKGNDGCGIVAVGILTCTLGMEKMHLASLGSISIIE